MITLTCQCCGAECYATSCDECGAEVTFAIDVEDSRIEFCSTELDNHYNVLFDGLYVGEVYMTKPKYQGEPYLAFNEEERANGKLVVEEKIPIHTADFLVWRFRGCEYDAMTWQDCIKQLFRLKGGDLICQLNADFQ